MPRGPVILQSAMGQRWITDRS